MMIIMIMIMMGSLARTMTTVVKMSQIVMIMILPSSAILNFIQVGNNECCGFAFIGASNLPGLDGKDGG